MACMEKLKYCGIHFFNAAAKFYLCVLFFFEFQSLSLSLSCRDEIRQRRKLRTRKELITKSTERYGGQIHGRVQRK